jgi:hypothetical protein
MTAPTPQALRIAGPPRARPPWTRGDCLDGERPCPHYLCKWWLQGPASCVLDVADRGGVTLDAVGQALGCTRERIRQIEVRALANLWRALQRAGLADDADPGFVPRALLQLRAQRGRLLECRRKRDARGGARGGRP